MKYRHAFLVLLGLVLLAAQVSNAQDEDVVRPVPLDEEDDPPVPRGAAVTRGHGGKPETASSGDDEDADEGSAEGVDASPGASEVSGPAGGEDAAPHEPTPRSAAAVAAEAATETAPAAAAGKAKFLEFNEKWLEETEGMAADFVNTPAMEHLKDGSFGAVASAELGFDPVAAITTAVHATLARCLHTLNVIRTIGMFHEGVIPRKVVVAGCDHRKFKLLFVLEKSSDWWRSRTVTSELSAVNARLFPFAQQMARRGHTVQVADVERLDQVEMAGLDAIIFVKVLERGFELLQNASVPLLWDHVDEWDGFPFWDLSSWELKETFTGVFTAGRVAKVAFDRAGIPAHVVYHNHGNTGHVHRADRTPPVKVVALQGDYHENEKSDIFPFLQTYCEKQNLTFLHGTDIGGDWEVQEYSAALGAAASDPSLLLGHSMGYSSVDVAVIWPKVYVQFHICYKPTNRLAHFASLGIPTIVYPFASYIDILVDFGYPLVAENLDDAALLLDRLVASPELRQEASAKLLEIAKYLSVEELAEEYEQGLCSFLSPEALDLRKVTPDEGPLRPER